MTTIGVRIKWVKILFLILFIFMVGIDAWLFYSLANTANPDTLLWAMSFVVLAIAIMLLVFTILSFIRKQDAILIENETVIIRNYKEKKLDYKDIINIQYAKSRSGSGGPNGLTPGEYKSGKIIFTLKDGKTVSVSEIKNVRQACSKLRREVLNSND